MSIIDRLKRLIFGASAEPVEQTQRARVVAVEAETRSLTFSRTARDLLKDATVLKREKKYIEACEKLREAYSADGAENLMIEDRLRLPMYLQLAGRADEGWGEMNRLNVTYVGEFSQARIAGQMATFLRKESKHKDAALFAVWTLCKQKEINIDTHASMVHLADQLPASDAESKELGLPPFPRGKKTGTTPSGNPIYDVGYPGVLRCLSDDFGPKDIRALLERDLVKVVAKKIISAMVADLSHYLAKSAPYDIEALKSIFGKHLV